jgi:hypothetical protein
MTRVRSLFSAALVTLLCTIPLLAHYPTKIKIDAAAKKQPAVTFDHIKHAEKLAKSCDTCHHTEKGLTKEQNATNKVDVKKCSTCHLDPKDKAPSMREMSLTKNPMHVRCINCHKEQKKGPTACTACHKKG